MHKPVPKSDPPKSSAHQTGQEAANPAWTSPSALALVRSGWPAAILAIAHACACASVTGPLGVGGGGMGTGMLLPKMELKSETKSEYANPLGVLADALIIQSGVTRTAAPPPALSMQRAAMAFHVIVPSRPQAMTGAPWELVPTMATFGEL